MSRNNYPPTSGYSGYRDPYGSRTALRASYASATQAGLEYDRNRRLEEAERADIREAERLSREEAARTGEAARARNEQKQIEEATRLSKLEEEERIACQQRYNRQEDEYLRLAAERLRIEAERLRIEAEQAPPVAAQDEEWRQQRLKSKQAAVLAAHPTDVAGARAGRGGVGAASSGVSSQRRPPTEEFDGFGEAATQKAPGTVRGSPGTQRRGPARPAPPAPTSSSGRSTPSISPRSSRRHAAAAADHDRLAVPGTSAMGKSPSPDPIELPLTTQCKGKCGFFGAEEFYGLCSNCHAKLQRQASDVKDNDVIQFLLDTAGFASLAEVQSAVAFSKLFPHASLKESAWDVGVKGMTSWTATCAPLTQYDAVPRRGESACTFIAAVLALKTIYYNVVPNPQQWANSIRTGIAAFHKCTDHTLKQGESQHKNVLEVLPYVVAAMWGQKKANKAFNTEIANTFEEKTVGLRMPPHIVSKEEYLVFVGPNAHHEIGVKGLCSAIGAIFAANTPTPDKAVDVLASGTDGSVDYSLAIVVTRPPETYCIVRGNKGEKVYFRDSHRKRQYDFDDVKQLQQWIELEKSYFVPSPNSPGYHNMVGLYTVCNSIKNGIAMATRPAASPEGAKGGQLVTTEFETLIPKF
eukprot:CAMPEP_0182918902 /NCGR_PEP_ID=MMETSP0105_2-20130417/2361_1 /TAXON_ID=81532 ORGANISM="Acanthoeca-like sp., Strain 10tr" /NCGR_SAMPLE_ID=MMETSP0105_2 /ASSEMBLY_ACC=CAM_ASM_000205 /LENGTH=637 /DNA_ID=CAMNT_0025056025 /DNA_START=159 /DNA_END=2071 /DNA_ORIENTATION=-